MPKPTFIERARTVYENNLLLVTIIMALVGLLMRFFAEPHPLNDLGKLGREMMKDVGGFILATFVIAFLYESFVNQRAREEFRRDLKDVLREGFRGGVEAVHERRPTLEYKANHLKSAEESVIELGTALSSFSDYLVKNMSTGMAPGSPGYRDIVEDRLRRGVVVKCLALDPEVAAQPGFKELSPHLEEKIRRALEQLIQLRTAFDAQYPGRFQLYLYRAVPTFACIAVDAESGTQGKLLLSPYVHGRENSNVPVFEIHQASSPGIYAAYQGSLKSLLATAKLLPGGKAPQK